MLGESHIWQYAWEVFNNWVGYFMGCCLMAVVIFYYTWQKESIPRKVLLSISALFIIMGGYKAWKTQLDHATEAERLQDYYLHQTHQSVENVSTFRDMVDRLQGIVNSNANAIDRLQGVVNSNVNVIAYQNAEINNAILQTDPAAKSVKQRAKILSDQISTFITTEEYEKIEYFPTTQESADVMLTMMESQTNKSEQSVARIFETTQSKEEEQRIGMWIKVYEQFYVQFGYRISAIQGQIAELGYKTPKIDHLLANKADDYTKLNHDLMGQFVHNALDAGSELQELAINIKDINQP